MNLSDPAWRHYLVIPRKETAPVKIDTILEERLRRYRCARELRLAALEKKAAARDLDGADRRRVTRANNLLTAEKHCHITDARRQEAMATYEAEH